MNAESATTLIDHWLRDNADRSLVEAHRVRDLLLDIRYAIGHTERPTVSVGETAHITN